MVIDHDDLGLHGLLPANAGHALFQQGKAVSGRDHHCDIRVCHVQRVRVLASLMADS